MYKYKQLRRPSSYSGQPTEDTEQTEDTKYAENKFM